MKLPRWLILTSLILLAGCTATSPQTNSTASDIDTTTSNLEELPPDVIVDDTEVPELEPLAGGSENLIGYWKSACLIPDENSDYAEQHYFVFYPNRTATHTRETFYKKTCTGSDKTLNNNYSYTIPTSGQINLTDLATGQTLYDMYQLQTGSLMFGHGFRNTFPYPSTIGVAESDRINTLNQYIVYTKAE